MKENLEELENPMKAKYKRLNLLILVMCSMATGAFLIFYNLKDNLVFFYSPTELKESDLIYEKKIRIGGLVKTGSLKREVLRIDEKNIEEISFVITDNNQEIIVSYFGILPDLFKEGQGVVAEGLFNSKKKIFRAKNILAKHDENYMPPEIKESLFLKGEEK